MPSDQFASYDFSLGIGYIILGTDPTNKAGSSTTIDEDFNTQLDNFLGRED